MGFFWHDHFAVSTIVLDSETRWWMPRHLNLLRNNSVGNLKALVYSVAIDWAMLNFLDGIRSNLRNPNENFARELWELFTLGRDNGYTQQDIEEAARAFTGFQSVLLPPPNDNRREIIFNSTLHDATDKTIFGLLLPGRSSNGELEYLDMVNLTFDHRPVAEFIGKKIWEYFVYTDPSQRVIDAVAKLFRDSNYEIAPVLQTIFTSKAFFSDRAKEGLVKSPVEHHIGFVRATGLNVPLVSLDFSLFSTYQRPTRPPDVNGWPSGERWLSAAGMLERANFIRGAIALRGNPPQNDPGGNLLIEPLLPPPGQRSAAEVVA